MEECDEKKEALLDHQDIKQKSAATAANTAKKEDKELEPVITQDEFDKLEKKEQKKKVFGFLNNLKKDKSEYFDGTNAHSTNEIEKRLNELMLKVEKLEGKLEISLSSKSETGERISNLAEEVGELRSMIFSREDTYSSIETEFEKIKESTAHIKPEKLRREMEENETEVMKVQAQIELQKKRIDEQEKTQARIAKILDKFKSYENLIDISKEIKKQVEKINDSEKYTARMAAKTEKIFAELDNRLTEFQKYKKETDDINEMLKDLVKSVDSLEIKNDSLMSKDSFSKIKQESDDRFVEIDTRIKILKDIVSTLVEKISARSVNISPDDLSALRSEIHEGIQRELEKTVPYDIVKKIESIESHGSDLNTRLGRIDAQIQKLQHEPGYEKNPFELPALPREKNKLLTQIDGLEPAAITANPPQEQHGIRPLHDSTDKQSEQLTSPAEEQEPSQVSLPQRHIEKAKSMLRIIKQKAAPSPVKTTEVSSGEQQSGSMQEPEEHLKQAETEKPKSIPKQFTEQNKKQVGDIKSELSRLKELYKETENLLEKQKESGKDIFRQQLLLDNASLDLGMAELDLLDGNEASTRQKIEKINAILERI